MGPGKVGELVWIWTVAITFALSNNALCYWSKSLVFYVLIPQRATDYEATFFLPWKYFYYFYIKCIRVTTLVRLHRFQVYNPMIHRQHIALCAHHPNSNLSSPYVWPPWPLHDLPTPFALTITIWLSVYEFCSFACHVCSFVAFSLKTNPSANATERTKYIRINFLKDVKDLSILKTTKQH